MGATTGTQKMLDERDGWSVTPPQLFRPSLRDALLLGVLGLAALGLGFYLRDIVDDRQLGLACKADEISLRCTARVAADFLLSWTAFGSVAVTAAVLHFLRPRAIMLDVSLVASLLGLLLFNTRLSALALALLALSFARAVPKAR